MSTADKLREEGRAEGLRLGMREGAASALLLMLASRFGNLPSATVGLVHDKTSDELSRIARELPPAANFDDVPFGEPQRGPAEERLACAVRAARAESYEPSYDRRGSLAAMFDEVIERFRDEGRKQGINQGRHDGAVSLLRTVLEQRFGPLPVLAIVCLQRGSLPEIERAARVALSAPTLDAVFTS